MTTPESETVVEELELGVNPNDLFTSPEEIKELEFIFKGKRWVIKYRELTWKEKYDCVDTAQVWGTGENGEGEFKFSLSTYYITSLVKMIKEAPFTPISETTLSRLDSQVGSILQTIVPLPADPEMASIIKKE